MTQSVFRPSRSAHFGFSASLLTLATLAGLALAAIVGASEVIESWRTGLEARATVVVLDDDAETVDRVAGALREASGVTAVRPLPRSELRRDARAWTGSDALIDAATPVMIDVSLRAGAETTDLEAALTGAGFADATRVHSHEAFAEDAEGLLTAVRDVALMGGAFLSLAASAVAAFSVSASVATHRGAFELLNDMGASWRFIAGQIARGYGVTAIITAAAGVALSWAAITLVAGRFAREFAGAGNVREASPIVYVAGAVGPLLTLLVCAAAGAAMVRVLRRSTDARGPVR